MEWLNDFFTQELFSLAIPVVIIIGIFLYAVRRAHFKHLERIRQIDETYNPKASFQRR